MGKKIKVYLVYQHSGEYEDYRKVLLKSFFNKENAENFMNLKKEELTLFQARFKYCYNCYPEDRSCPYFELDIDFPEEGCINRVDWSNIEGIYYTLEEIEVE